MRLKDRTMNEIAETLPLPRRPWLQRLGDLMQEKRNLIQSIQWFVVIFYLTLLIWPALLPLPKDYVHFYENLILFAQFIFWGIWWPFVMLSMILIGRVWCGVFCPEGSLTEWSSHHGLGRKIPKWMRWGGWPFVAFVLTTVYGQLVSVYEYPKAALLILGGSTVAAMIIGFIYGRGKRVWCRHLCPANGVFSLLSRLAPVHFNIDKEIWKQAPRCTPAVDCAPLINVRDMTGNSTCHMCGRCSGYRDAVILEPRSPNVEIVSIKKDEANHWDIHLLMFGMLGVATGAFQWSASPWFIQLKQSIAEWLIERDSYWMLNDNAPWWLLTHYPETNDVFSWLDGASILLYIGAMALSIGGLILSGLWLAGRIIKEDQPVPWRLGYALTPLAGLSIFLGLTALTLSMLKAEHISLVGIAEIRVLLLSLAYLWSGFLLWQMLVKSEVARWRQISAWGIIMASASLVGLSWVMMFFIW
ncbi:Polyferredoxin [hydrothermal vent metagenome]|uniref:Polyferredoxin n=1 Tax=hydrothermal vent metagenome TaxID=652676 RepID=A0A3B1AU27_9ZZZZ